MWEYSTPKRLKVTYSTTKTGFKQTGLPEGLGNFASRGLIATPTMYVGFRFS